MSKPLFTREFELTQQDPITLRNTTVAELRIDGASIDDCWQQAEQWRDENQPSAQIMGVFKDKAIWPDIKIKRI